MYHSADLQKPMKQQIPSLVKDSRALTFNKGEATFSYKTTGVFYKDVDRLTLPWKETLYVQVAAPDAEKTNTGVGWFKMDDISYIF